jgi:hypothetical protein
MTQKVDVLKDPNSKGTADDIKNQYAFGLKVYENIKSCFKMIDDLETKRAKLLNISTTTSDKAKAEMATKLEDDLYKIEAQIHDIHATGARQDVFRNPAQLLERFLSISKEAINSSADYPPTQQHQAVFNSLNNKFDEVKKAYDTINKDAVWSKIGYFKA